MGCYRGPQMTRCLRSMPLGEAAKTVSGSMHGRIIYITGPSADSAGVCGISKNGEFDIMASPLCVVVSLLKNACVRKKGIQK